MQTLMDVVPGIKITAQHALEVLPDQLFDHLSAPRMVIFILPDGRCGGAPDIPVSAIFSPAGFIRLHRRAGADFCFESLEHGLRMLLDPMQQFHELPKTHLKAVEISQHVAKLAKGNRITVRK